MISSPSLRSWPTVKSAASLSPRAGKVFCARAGTVPSGIAIAQAQSAATKRRQRGLGVGGLVIGPGSRGYDASESFPHCFFSSPLLGRPLRRAVERFPSQKPVPL